ncbi:MAG TPA: hypothetical protein VHL11_12960 [Phototrophicaceae bacterium]|jgi:hypothetical protein|nr:hypothetical protein [Phototrophicaceae bacterium]
MKLRLIVLAFSGSLLLSACAPAVELLNPGYLEDTSLIDATPCEAPCWRNITPGVTEWTKAVAQLQDDGTLQDVKEQPSDETSEIAATFQRRDGIPCCLIYTHDGKVVDQILLQLAPKTTAGQVIEKYGEPTYVTGNEVSGEQAAIALYYPEQQMVVYAFAAGKEKGTLSATSEIFAVLYVRADDMDDVLVHSSLYKWDGYKSYAAYITGTYDITAVPTVEGGATDEPSATDETSVTEEPAATSEVNATEEASATDEPAATDEAAATEEVK